MTDEQLIRHIHSEAQELHAHSWKGRSAAENICIFAAELWQRSASKKISVIEGAVDDVQKKGDTPA